MTGNVLADAFTLSGKALRLLASAMQQKRPNRPLGGYSGVSPGTPSSIVAAAPAHWTVQPFAGFIDLSAASDGGTPFAFDTVVTGDMTAADTNNPRVDLLYVRHDDPAENDGTATPAAVIGYAIGVPSGSGAAAPATPARAFPLAQINVPKLNNGNPTVTWVAPATVAAGGILLTAGPDAWPDEPFLGQYIDDPDLGLLRWNGSAWKRPTGPTFTALPIPGTSDAGGSTPRYLHDPALHKVTLRGSLSAHGDGDYPDGGLELYHHGWPAEITPVDASRFVPVAIGNSGGNGGVGRLQIAIDGTVTLLCVGSPSFISLDNVEYYL